MTHIEAWLAGEYTTSELHSELTDSEYLRWLRSDYAEELFCRYESLYETPRMVYGFTIDTDGTVTTYSYVADYSVAVNRDFEGKKPIVYTLQTAEGCELEWSHGGFAS
jgi:hypothetical protein